MQTEDYVNNESKALNGLFAAHMACESNTLSAQMVCLTHHVDLNQRKLHRNPKVRVLTSSDAVLERENSGFSM
ncbi:MAG: hypothetical protein ACO2Y2_08075 [Poseidonia sp.]